METISVVLCLLWKRSGVLGQGPVLHRQTRGDTLKHRTNQPSGTMRQQG